MVSSKTPAPRPRKSRASHATHWGKTKRLIRENGIKKTTEMPPNWVERRNGRPQILDWGKAYFSDQVDPYNARVSDRTQLSQVDLWHFPKGEADKRVRVLFEEYAHHPRNTIQHIQGMYASRHKLASLTASLLLNEGFWGPLLMQLREHVADLFFPPLAASLFGSTPMQKMATSRFPFLFFFLLCLPPIRPSCHSCQPDALKVGLPVEPTPPPSPRELLGTKSLFYVLLSMVCMYNVHRLLLQMACMNRTAADDDYQTQVL